MIVWCLVSWVLYFEEYNLDKVSFCIFTVFQITHKIVRCISMDSTIFNCGIHSIPQLMLECWNQIKHVSSNICYFLKENTFKCLPSVFHTTLWLYITITLHLHAKNVFFITDLFILILFFPLLTHMFLYCVPHSPHRSQKRIYHLKLEL